MLFLLQRATERREERQRERRRERQEALEGPTTAPIQVA